MYHVFALAVWKGAILGDLVTSMKWIYVFLHLLFYLRKFISFNMGSNESSEITVL